MAVLSEHAGKPETAGIVVEEINERIMDEFLIIAKEEAKVVFAEIKEIMTKEVK